MHESVRDSSGLVVAVSLAVGELKDTIECLH